MRRGPAVPLELHDPRLELRHRPGKSADELLPLLCKLRLHDLLEVVAVMALKAGALANCEAHFIAF